MSNTIEWAEATFAARNTFIVEPEEFNDEDSPYFDHDGAYEGKDTFGIRVESGGHTTLVVGTLAELQAWAIEILGEVYYTDRKREGD